MRLWSINPEYLDNIGLVALWREGLLAKAVLEGKTKGYKNHPQLERFKNHKYPIKAINTYLYYVLLESNNRGFNFNKNKIKYFKLTQKIVISSGQIEYESKHLLRKLKKRNKLKFKELSKEEKISSHPVIRVKKSVLIEPWEKIN